MVKRDLRARFRRARAAVSAQERADAARAISAQLLQLVQPTARAMIYVGVRHELGTEAIIEALLQREQPLAVPRMEGDQLVAAKLGRRSDLIPGLYNVPTSAGDALTPLDICITPGVAFTKQGDRLGQGGGHYDRFFAANPNLWRIGIAYDEQIAATLSVETHDVRMHTLITPTRCWGLTQRP